MSGSRIRNTSRKSMEYFSSNPLLQLLQSTTILARDCRLLLDREEVQRRRKSQRVLGIYPLLRCISRPTTLQANCHPFCLPSKPKAREHKSQSSPFPHFFGLPLKVVRRTGGLFSSCDGFAHKSKSVFAPLHSGATVG